MPRIIFELDDVYAYKELISCFAKFVVFENISCFMRLCLDIPNESSKEQSSPTLVWEYQAKSSEFPNRIKSFQYISLSIQIYSSETTCRPRENNKGSCDVCQSSHQNVDDNIMITARLICVCLHCNVHSWSYCKVKTPIPDRNGQNYAYNTSLVIYSCFFYVLLVYYD